MDTTNQLNVTDLNISADLKSELLGSIANYGRAGISITLLNVNNKTITVKIKQERLINGYILNNKQLYERAKNAFAILANFKIKIISVVYSLDINEINLNWINEKMIEFGINRKDLIKQLAIDYSSASLILSGRRELSKPMKATFYYYFLTFKLNRDLRG